MFCIIRYKAAKYTWALSRWRLLYYQMSGYGLQCEDSVKVLSSKLNSPTAIGARQITAL